MKSELIEIGSSLYEQALELRYQLFFKDLGFDKSVTADELELSSLHLAISSNGELIAYGRLSPLVQEDQTYRISQIVVQPSQRRKGYASQIVTRLMEEAKRLPCKSLVLNAQIHAIKLYQNLGFVKSGPEYKTKLTGVLHQKMRYQFNR